MGSSVLWSITLMGIPDDDPTKNRNMLVWLTRYYNKEYLETIECILRAQLVEALRCKPKVAGSIPDYVIGIFHWHNPSDRTMALGSTQPLTEMSTRNISWGQRRPVRRADLTTFMRRLSRNLRASASWNPLGLSRPVTGLLYLYPIECILLNWILQDQIINNSQYEQYKKKKLWVWQKYFARKPCC
jgi:hypothetical protein